MVGREEISRTAIHIHSFPICFAMKGRTEMFDFVEQPVTIRDSEFPMLQKHPSRVVVQSGLQPVTFVQEDITKLERPQSLLTSLFKGKKKKG